MLTSKSICAATRLTANTDLTDFLCEAGYLFKEASGLYSLGTLGALGLRRLEDRLHSTLRRQGVAQCQLSLLQSQHLWDTTGRAQDYGDELMSVRLRSGQTMRLSATAEEQITHMVKAHMNGRHLDHWFYQLGTKWRDEIRARAGLLRSREFRMMDAYHFASDETSMCDTYHHGLEFLSEFVRSLGFDVRTCQSDCGEIGGLLSHEIQVRSTLDDSEWLEVGHCFALGQKYSQAFDLKSATGEHAWMSCQGIGTTRLLAAALHDRRQGNTLLGNNTFSVCDDVVVSIGLTQDTLERARFLYNALRRSGREVLWEDRYGRAGQALSASETLGACRRLVVSDRLGDGVVEATDWSEGSTQVVNITDVLQ